MAAAPELRVGKCTSVPAHVSHLGRKGSPKMEHLNPRKNGNLVSSQPSTVVSAGTANGVTCKFLGFPSFLFSCLYHTVFTS